MMKKIKITVLKKVFHEELANLYERSSSNMCNMQEDMTFIVVDLNQPKGMCASAWHSLYPTRRLRWLLQPHSSTTPNGNKDAQESYRV